MKGRFQALKQKVMEDDPEGHQELKSITDQFQKLHPDREPAKSVAAFITYTFFEEPEQEEIMDEGQDIC